MAIVAQLVCMTERRNVAMKNCANENRLTRNTIELYSTIFKIFNKNRWRLVLNLIILNISGYWLKIIKLLKKYDSEIAGSTIETTHSMVFRNRMRCLETSANSLQFYRISLITFLF